MGALQEIPATCDEKEDEQGAIAQLPHIPAAKSDTVGDCEEKSEIENGFARGRERGKKSPSNQGKRKSQGRDVVFDETRIEEDNADQQNRNPLPEREAATEEFAGQVEEERKEGDRVAEIKDKAGR